MTDHSTVDGYGICSSKIALLIVVHALMHRGHNSDTTPAHPGDTGPSRIAHEPSLMSY